MTILVMFVFKLFGFFSSCFMTLPVLLPINAHPSKDNKEGGPIIPYWIETKIKFWCFIHIVFNFQVPASWVKNAYAKLIELNKNIRDAETQEIPTIVVGPDFDHKKFFREYVKRPHPGPAERIRERYPGSKKMVGGLGSREFRERKGVDKDFVGR